MLKRTSVFYSRAYVLTYITEFTVIIAGILVYKLAADILGKDGFNEYSLCRRTISFIHPLFIIGLGVGLPRYVAFATKQTAPVYLYATLIVFSIIAMVVFPVFYFFSNNFAYLLFGDEKYHYLIPVLLFMVGSMMLHSAVYGYFRGAMLVTRANILQLCNLGIVPVAVFFCTDSIYYLLWITGICWYSIAFVFLLTVIKPGQLTHAPVKKNIRELVVYGIQRVPGDVAVAGLFSLPAYFAAHMVNDNLETAGNVAFSMSVLNMIGAAFGPICLLLLPQASKAIAAGNFHQLKKNVNEVLLLTIVLSLIGLALIEMFTSFFIQLFVKQSVDQLVYFVRIIMIGCVGYAVYISLRSVLDAYYVKAINTRNIIAAFIVFVAASYIIYYMQAQLDYMLYAFVASMTLLGLLTWYETMRIFNRQLEKPVL